MHVRDYLNSEDIAHFTARSDLHAWRLVLGNWLAIIAILTCIGAWPNPFTVVIGAVLLAGRQLGLAVLMHEAGHRTLFRTLWLNDVAGQWLCALPVMNDLKSYARGHLAHHRMAGTEDDPDLPNYRDYPVSPQSFRRKLVRDLSGQTGAKLLAYLFRGASGIVSHARRENATPLLQQLLVQALLLLALAAAGIAWTWLVWAGAWLTVFMFVIRVRQVAEHAAVPDLYDPDPRNNTRTVDAPWWQRLLFAPNGVNFHMEHHFMASVPCYRLAALRRHLRERGALDGVPVFNGYGQVLRHAIRPAPT